MSNTNILEWIGIGVAAIALVAIIGLIFGVPTMLLWGYLIPALFPGAVTAGTVVAKITFWQAFWLNIFCGILFKSVSHSKS
jgi:hypothetical protein